jgi:hypothetical protein
MDYAPDGKLTIKVTIIGVQHPELFHAMRSIKDLRRRSTRIRDLAAKALLDERRNPAVAGGQAMQVENLSGAQRVERMKGTGHTVDEMLQWGDGDS